MRPTAHGDTISILPYRTKEVGALVREAKFKGSAQAWELLACALSEFLNEYLGDRHGYEARTAVLVPVPLSRKRFRERGYNQAEEVLKRTKVPGAEVLPRVLRRTRDTKAQTSLSGSARRENLVGAFSATIPDAAYLYIVVDDVMTTGSTLKDAVRALKEAGARHVLAVSLSH